MYTKASYSKGFQKKGPKCYNCGKIGYYKTDCRSKKSYYAQTEEKTDENTKKSDTALLVHSTTEKVNENAWYLDSCASTHLTMNREWLNENVINTEAKIKIANNRKDIETTKGISAVLPIENVDEEQDQENDGLPDEQTNSNSDDSNQDINDENNETLDIEEPRITRTEREVHKPKHFDDYEIYAAYESENDPQTYKEAYKSEQWQKAIQSEIISHDKLKTWLITDLPDGNKIETENVVRDSKERLNARDMGEVKRFSGMEILKTDKTLKITQRTYIEKVLEEFSMSECRGVSTPMCTRFTIDLSKNDTIDVPYRKVIGSLMYLACTFRPDIMYAVSYLSRFLDKPNQDLWTADFGKLHLPTNKAGILQCLDQPGQSEPPSTYDSKFLDGSVYSLQVWIPPINMLIGYSYLTFMSSWKIPKATQPFQLLKADSEHFEKLERLTAVLYDETTPFSSINQIRKELRMLFYNISVGQFIKPVFGRLAHKHSK
ncbi:hypothetical protein JTB14_006782 [Gonioctena quinquepunctata]|nr:hypothetical protein JTB14_006782 [Gonioctena quinquepunctata]